MHKKLIFCFYLASFIANADTGSDWLELVNKDCIHYMESLDSQRNGPLYKIAVERDVVKSRILLDSDDELSRLAGAYAFSNFGKNSNSNIIFAELMLFSQRPLNPIFHNVHSSIKKSQYRKEDVYSIIFLTHGKKCSTQSLAVYFSLLPDSAIELIAKCDYECMTADALGIWLQQCIERHLSFAENAQNILSQYKYFEGDLKVYYFSSKLRTSDDDIIMLKKYLLSAKKQNKYLLEALYKKYVTTHEPINTGTNDANPVTTHGPTSSAQTVPNKK